MCIASSLFFLLQANFTLCCNIRSTCRFSVCRFFTLFIILILLWAVVLVLEQTRSMDPCSELVPNLAFLVLGFYKLLNVDLFIILYMNFTWPSENIALAFVFYDNRQAKEDEPRFQTWTTIMLMDFVVGGSKSVVARGLVLQYHRKPWLQKRPACREAWNHHSA